MRLMELPLLLIIPLIVGVITQLIKFVVDRFRSGHWRTQALSDYGGMPSGHSAFVVSLVTVVALAEGVRSIAFAITFVFAGIIIRDAVGLRMYLGGHGKALNHLVRTLPTDEQAQFPILRERLGHTYGEATMGAILGLVLAYVLYRWLV